MTNPSKAASVRAKDWKATMRCPNCGQRGVFSWNLFLIVIGRYFGWTRVYIPAAKTWRWMKRSKR